MLMKATAPQFDAVEDAPLPVKEHQINFTGSAGEYFKIWIVNIALTILTLGIYAPWAKVRREQYMLGHTYLGDSSFDYTADPVKILKGRLIVFGILAVYFVINAIAPIFSLVLLIPIFFLMPWIINSAIRFRARYTSYRNVRFGFGGTYGSSFIYFLLLPFLGAIPAGLGVPWAKFRQKKYIFENFRFGTTNFKFNGRLGSFYKAYLIALLLFLIPISIFAFRAMASTFAGEDAAFSLMEGSFGALLLVFSGFFVIIATPLLLRTLLAIASLRELEIAGLKMKVSVSPQRYVWILLSNFLLRVVTFGLATPYCEIRARRYVANNLSFSGPTTLNNFVAERTAEVRALGDEASDLYDIDLDFGF